MEITTSIVIRGETKLILTAAEAKLMHGELEKWLSEVAPSTEPWYPRAFKPMIKKPVKLCDTPYNINPIK